MSVVVVEQLTGVRIQEPEARSRRRDLLGGTEVLDVAIEGFAPSLGVAVAGVADVTASGGPGLVVWFAVGFESGAEAFEEAGQGVAVPFFERVGVQGDARAPALFGHDLDDSWRAGPG